MSARDPGATSGSTARYAEKPPCVCGMAEVYHIIRSKGRGPCGACVPGASGAPVRCPCLVFRPQRVSTPRVTRPSGGKTITVQRVCNGCGNDIGDATEPELVAAMLGRDLPDATADCPTCWAAANLPTVKPLSQSVAAATKPARTQARVRGANRG